MHSKVMLALVNGQSYVTVVPGKDTELPTPNLEDVPSFVPEGLHEEYRAVLRNAFANAPKTVGDLDVEPVDVVAGGLAACQEDGNGWCMVTDLNGRTALIRADQVVSLRLLGEDEARLYPTPLDEEIPAA